jgi:hypothetical protein
MPSPDFKDRALNAILQDGTQGQFTYPWHKVLTGTAVQQVTCLAQLAGNPAGLTYPGTAKVVYSVGPALAPYALGGSALAIGSAERGYVTRLGCYSPVANMSGALLLGDLLATYRGIPADTAVAQDLSTLGSAAGNSVLPRYQDGVGVKIFADVTTAVGATPVTLTVSYTNELGVSGRTSTSTTVASAPQARSLVTNKGEPFSLPLQSGDKGVRSIQTATLSGTTGAAGVYTLFLYKPLILNVCTPQSGLTTHNYGLTIIDSAMLTSEIRSGAFLIMFWLPPTTAVNDVLSGDFTICHVKRGR